ncbi:MAG: replication-associated recombination protein A [Chloroflexi bacterium]|nr:replication-associated recombination protein A [Chloroflexota bacterium]
MPRSSADQPALFDEPTSGLPLAARMRPRSIDEIVGQQAILRPGLPLRRAVESGRTGSLVLWGPPGSGKTTLARLIAAASGSAVEQISAVTEGIAELRQIIARARQRGGRTTVIVDEIHRWSRSQQAALLPHVEEGAIALIGVTSENPYFDVIAPLRSRLRIFRLEPLDREDVLTILRRALADPERGVGDLGLRADDDALEALAALSAGDARSALNVLEAAAQAVRAAGGETIDRAAIAEASQARQVRYDRQADDHYQTISAFIKSVRGSDADAAIFWLAKMLVAGEELRFITRRLVILASEDIGNANPNALVVAQAAAQAVELVGYPEAELILAQATLYLALAPKSNAAMRALHAAKAAIAGGASTDVPLHLRNASFGGAKGLGYGRDYRYPHDFPGNLVEQQYLPDGVTGDFYEPSDRGYEQTHRDRLDAIRDHLRGRTANQPQRD